MPVGREDHQERKARRISSYKGRAAKATETAEQLHDRAREMGSVIPLGQPILVGHHSEGRHRALLKRIDAKHRQASEAYDKADYYEGKAASAEGNNSISGDDPEAMARYQEKLAKLEKSQEQMKAINKAFKKGEAAAIEAMKAEGLSEKSIATIVESIRQYPGRVPFAAWALSNNNAEIRRVKEKIEALKKLDDMAAEKIKFAGGELVVNVEINRVQIIFDDIPGPEVRAMLKARGFRWARSEGAWQRQRTMNAIQTAKRLIAEFAGGGK